MTHGGGVQKGDHLHMNHGHHLETPYCAQLRGQGDCCRGPVKSVRDGEIKERKKKGGDGGGGGWTQTERGRERERERDSNLCVLEVGVGGVERN